MLNELKDTEILCDAPPYGVVAACADIGFQSPLDVRWCRMSHFLAQQRGRWDRFPWKLLLGRRRPKKEACGCGQPLPVLRKYAVTFASGNVTEYLQGQCPRCRTIFWDEA